MVLIKTDAVTVASITNEGAENIECAECGCEVMPDDVFYREAVSGDVFCSIGCVNARYQSNVLQYHKFSPGKLDISETA